jgi:hypothetical protein
MPALVGIQAAGQPLPDAMPVRCIPATSAENPVHGASTLGKAAGDLLIKPRADARKLELAK